MGHGEEGSPIRITTAANNRPITLDEAVSIARGPFPHAEVRRIATPNGEKGAYRVNVRRPNEINVRHPATMVWIDLWSGQIREVRNPKLFTPGQPFVTRLWPIHTGEAFGSPGRLLWFFMGLTTALLYASGLTQWLIRRKATQDRDVDFSALKPWLERAARALYRHAVFVAQVIRSFGAWAWDRAKRDFTVGTGKSFASLPITEH